MSAAWGVLAAAALVAILELDVVQFGQIMVSRPLVLGPLLGLLFGMPHAGLPLGICCELLSLDDLPMGDRLPWNGAIAVSAAFLLGVGPRPLALELALPAGLGAGWAHQRLEIFLRHRRRSLCCRAEASLKRAENPELGRMILTALAQQAAATFAFLTAFVFLLGPILYWAWPHAPRAVVEGLRCAWALAPWLGLGALLYSLKVTP